MECNNPQIPDYLDRNFRSALPKSKQWYFHKAYRDIPEGANEIDFPGGRINAISCKWSKLIKRLDIPKVEPYSSDYRFAYFKEIFSFSLARQFVDQTDYTGTHVLCCTIEHTPQECNYSHIEILINHKIFDLDTGKEKYDHTYTYHEWENGTPLLKRGNRFFKMLRSDFRLALIKVLKRMPDQNFLMSDLKAFLGII